MLDIIKTLHTKDMQIWNHSYLGYQTRADKDNILNLYGVPANRLLCLFSLANRAGLDILLMRGRIFLQYTLEFKPTTIIYSL